MKSSKKYYINLDFIRVLSLIAILFYHLNILKGGYLAVCIFFVLSGYLSCISLFKKEKISLKEYYKNRLIKIYLPLLIIVFITIGIISFLPSIKWLNLKPETTSVLLGYNNFWQLSANLDYFARHVNSPFIHLWYIGVLLQFDLIFPFIFKGLKKLGEKTKRIVPCIVIGVLTILFTLYFYKMSLTDNIMITYYSTFTRVFSLLFGVSLGFIHSYYSYLIPKFFKNKKGKKKNKKKKKTKIDLILNKKSTLVKYITKNINKIIFSIYIIIITLLFIFIDAKSIFFPYSMILVTIISCRLIDYGINIKESKITVFNKIIKSLSSVSYEIYLIQYPVIFLFQYIGMNNIIKYFLIILITVILSYIIHFSIDCKNNNHKKLRYIIFSFVAIFSLYGIFSFITLPDYSKEMKKLENQLEQNQEIIEKRQEEYKLKLEEEKQNYEKLLNDLETGEQNLEEVVKNLSVVGVGDSVMLGAVENLYNKFPNGYFDAQISRTAWVARGILSDLKNNNMLGDVVIFNLGANGDCSEDCKNNIIELCENRHVFWLTVTNDRDVNVNKELFELSNKYKNLHIIDWETISKGHSEYFFADGIHLTGKGREIYTDTIYNSIYEVYLNEYQNKKEDLIKEQEEKAKNKITFYGNDILLNVYSNIEENFESSNFNINNEYNYEKLRIDIESSIKCDTITNKIVFAFDKLSNLRLKQYKELIDLCKDKKLYILSTDKYLSDKLKELNNKNVIIIDFYNEINKNDNYLMLDGIHLTDEGNKALEKILNDNIEK